ncbi:AsnC family transcriptional regulator [Halorussus ruber]|uniref:AsnC family transcriptional regulator n=1 Tax=Halorussus ruber TaxID=1126238 RepID=UPI001092C50E|nr:AsnC family transcriptional regulator [Halorussus ruber]
MTELDDTDTEILQLLMEDARRSYKEIGEEVGLSAPSVSNRVERLEELGVIRGFTLDLDRSVLATGDEVVLEIDARPGSGDEVAETLREFDFVEHVVRAIDPRIVAYGHMDDRELRHLFEEALDPDSLEDYAIRKVAESSWQPNVDGADLALECAECGKPVHEGGVTVEMDDRRYHMCCTSCESLFRERYEELKEAA